MAVPQPGLHAAMLDELTEHQLQLRRMAKGATVSCGVDIVADDRFDSPRPVRAAQKVGAERSRDDLGKVLVLGDGLDLLRGETAHRDTVPEAQHRQLPRTIQPKDMIAEGSAGRFDLDQSALRARAGRTCESPAAIATTYGAAN